jgi:hypothetical protein
VNWMSELLEEPLIALMLGQRKQLKKLERPKLMTSTTIVSGGFWKQVSKAGLMDKIVKKMSHERSPSNSEESLACSTAAHTNKVSFGGEKRGSCGRITCVKL